jgi:ABC-type phosphate/phosphonate transport system permease subunit
MISLGTFRQLIALAVESDSNPIGLLAQVFDEVVAHCNNPLVAQGSSQVTIVQNDLGVQIFARRTGPLLPRMHRHYVYNVPVWEGAE